MMWRVCSLVAIGMIAIFCLLNTYTEAIGWWRAAKSNVPGEANNPRGKDRFRRLRDRISQVTWLVYMLARLVILALTLASIRALPAGAYLSVNWLAIIPHI
jgi:hypothetical protein